jgi:nitroreductase
VLATVDGHPVTEAELRVYAATTSGDLSTAQGRRAALDGLVRFKAAQLDAAARHLVTTVDYPDILAALRADNARRAAAATAGHVVYGTVAYDATTYYAHLESTVQQELLDDLLRTGEINPTDAALHAYYDAHAHEYATTPGDVTLQEVRADDTATGRAAAQRAIAAVAAGQPLATAARAAGLDPAVTTIRVDDADHDDLATTHPSLVAAVAGLKVGQAASVRDDEDGGLLVVRVTARTAGATTGFAEAKDETRVRYEQDRYQAHVDQLVARARVDVLVDPSRPLP